jgi:hypothetical protein
MVKEKEQQQNLQNMGMTLFTPFKATLTWRLIKYFCLIVAVGGLWLMGLSMVVGWVGEFGIKLWWGITIVALIGWLVSWIYHFIKKRKLMEKE